jgi:hypothetical protein
MDKETWKAQWRAAVEEADSLIDCIGRPVDLFIRDTVAILRLYGFPTTASCEGHLERRCHYPWVDIEVAETIAPLNEGKLKGERDLESLLEAFHRQRSDPSYAVLIIDKLKGGNIRLHCAEGDDVELLHGEKLEERLECHQKVMREFTFFLKERYANA